MAEKDDSYWASPAETATQPKQETSKLGAAAAFVRSMGRETTAGLTDYPAAALMAGVRRAQGLPFDYQEALRDVRGQTREIQELYPTASTAGRLTGGVLGSVGPGGSVARVAARSAALGGVSGFTGREGMEGAVGDVATGAAIGGGLGLLGGAVGRAYASPAETFVRNAYKENQREFASKYATKATQNMEKLDKVVNRVRSTSVAPTPTQAAPFIQAQKARTTDDIINDIANNTVSGVKLSPKDVKLAKDYQANTRIAMQAEQRAELADVLSGPDLYSLAGKSLKFEGGRAGTSYMQTAKEMLPNIALGAAGGAGMGLMSGVGPATGAAMGAGLGGMYELKARGAGVIPKLGAAALARVAPSGAGAELGARMATRYGVEPVEPEVDYSIPAEQYVPQAPQPRLLRLAEEFRARMGGAQ